MKNLKTVRARFARNAGLPAAQVLTEAKILAVLNDHGIKYRPRPRPVTTIRAFFLRCSATTTVVAMPSSRIIAHRAASASGFAR